MPTYFGYFWMMSAISVKVGMSKIWRSIPSEDRRPWNQQQSPLHLSSLCSVYMASTATQVSSLSTSYSDLPLSSLPLYRFKSSEIIRDHQRHGAIVRSADGSQAARSDDPEAGSLTSPSAQGSAGCWVSGAFMSTGFSNVLQYGV